MTHDPRAKAVPAAWAAPLQLWRQWLTAAGRSRQTINTRLDHLQRLARAVNGSPWHLTPETLIEWVSAQDWMPETRRSIYTSIRLFYAWALDAGYVSESPATHLPKVRATEPKPRPCPDPVLLHARRAADDRVALMLRLGSELGLRRSEIAQVHLDDVERDLLGFSLIVHGKGNRDRVLPMTKDLALAVLKACREGNGWAFPGRIDGHLSARYVGKLMTQVLSGPWTPHTLRHRFATVVNNESGDLIAVQQLLGHASLATTQRYVATTDDRLRKAAGFAAAA